MTLRRLAPALATALAALMGAAVAGCGGSSHTISPTTPLTTSSSATAPNTTTSAPAPAHAATVPPGGPVPAGFVPVSFTAVSPRTYWLLGNAPCSRPVCTSIVRTIDGGARFVGLPAPVEKLAGPTAATGLTTLRFADDLHGFAGSGGGHPAPGPLWETRDGGEHWSTALSDVIAFDTGAGNVYALTGACAGSTCRDLQLRRSPIGADRWSTTTLPLTAQASPMPMTVHGTSVWISLTRAGGRAEAQTLVSSSDAGAQLSVRRSPCVSELGGTLAASSSTVVWAVCPTGMAAGAWRSTDGGARWMALNLRSAGGTASPLTNAATIGPASDTTAVITTGGDRTPIRTTNGGQSFTRVSGGPASGDWGYVGFTDPLTGTALITGAGPAGTSSGLPAYGLWRSGDGGTHWGGPVRVG